MVYFGYQVGTAQAAASQDANAIVVLLIGVVELIQSHYAHKQTAAKAVEQASK
jgi:hypothetical protein